MTIDPQDFLWFIPAKFGSLWWLVCSFFSLTGAFLCFLYLIMNQKFSAVVFTRMVMVGGMLLLGLVPLNWGWLPWGVMLISIGSGLSYFLIATRWCERHDKWAIFMSWFRPRTKHDHIPVRHR